MCPALHANQSNAQSPKVRTGRQSLSGINAPGNRCVGDIDHAMLLSEGLVDVVDIAKRWIPAGIELLYSDQSCNAVWQR